jgi:hypothetical protein
VKPYQVVAVQSAAEMESLLNNAWTQGYRYRDAIPSTDPTLFGGSRTGRFVVVLEHVGVEQAVRAAPTADAR